MATQAGGLPKFYQKNRSKTRMGILKGENRTFPEEGNASSS